jgi:hypothetical protein
MTSQQLAYVGRRFSNLEVLSVEKVKDGHAIATCRCDCGNTKPIRLNHVLRGVQKGCGCGRAHTRTHGMAGTRIYQIWRTMRARCENPKDKGYPSYGGRGIAVCERWKQFANFYADMGDKPAGMSLDRRDVNGNYEPSNCRWATKIEQQNNTTRSHFVTYRGKAMTVAEAMRLSDCKVPYTTVYGRLNRGWSVERALSHTGAA